jgi:L-threonylcarbamoyladenylate synthase
VLTAAQLEAACGQKLWLPAEMHGVGPKASGTLESHYAPHAKVRLMDGRSLQTALDVLGAEAPRIAVYARQVMRSRSSKVLLRRMPDDAVEAARQLFAVLREFDDHGVQLIWIESPPVDTAWDGVRDRLQRAAAG